jgi:hypothetical protein
MNLHETHQFYFERYLRKKLGADERLDFEQKLKDDRAFSHAFEDYKIHRKAHLKELISHYNTEFKASSRNTILIYLLITLIVLAVSIILYYDNRKMRQELYQFYDKSTKSIYRAIPFINKQLDGATDSGPTSLNTEKDTAVANEMTVFNNADDLAIEKDRLLADTLYLLIDTYSSISDSSLQDSIVNSNEISETRTIGVSLWQSPVGFYGYRFNGNKLQLFGIKLFDEVKFELDKNDIWLHMNSQSLLLVADDVYYKFPR